jgi:succinate dehydrogenase/fumarate reductase cytochrome b subunit
LPIQCGAVQRNVTSSAITEDLAVFVWLFHRVSGLLLVVLLPVQIASGIFQGGATDLDTARAWGDLHAQALLNCLLAFLVIFHGLYGVRALLLDMGIKREKPLFWICTLLGAVLFGGFLFLFFTFGGK